MRLMTWRVVSISPWYEVDAVCGRGVFSTVVKAGDLQAVAKVGRLSGPTSRMVIGLSRACRVLAHTGARTRLVVADRPMSIHSRPDMTPFGKDDGDAGEGSTGVVDGEVAIKVGA
jgi:hypothetical protein